jgi:hypothetical protein
MLKEIVHEGKVRIYLAQNRIKLHICVNMVMIFSGP